jgi:hypothetical protein
VNNKKKKVLAVFLAPIAVLGLVATMFTTSALATIGAPDGQTQQSNDGSQGLAEQALAVNDAYVLPWCGWIALTAANDGINMTPVSDLAIGYDGNEIELEADGQEFAIKVGPTTSGAVAAGTPFAKEDADNCSWFTDGSKNGVNVQTRVSGNSFTGVSDANSLSIPDSSMDFSSDGSNVLKLNSTEGPTCAAEGFDFSNNPMDINASGEQDKDLVSLTAGLTLTNSFCSWTTKYTVKIPSGLTPLFGDSTYTYTGPTVTNTMIYSRVTP